MNNRAEHWQNIYANKQPNEVSWTQDVPKTSLDFIKGFMLPKDAAIIDIGGGDSKLVDFLLEAGYTNLTVLDISQHALDRAKKRLGVNADRVKWIVSDITQFKPTEKYDVWHDRAVFHFLTTEDEVQQYISIAQQAVTNFMVIGTFSESGPEKCSGLNIKQYNEAALSLILRQYFDKLKCFTEDHVTPFDTVQNFLFCSFRKMAA
ncbi:MAG TPA: class I SAM-dependent methyltransferase [Flavipsychrobacter sp.]|nr:class I SAM-dependent methyltransferase [Flavipsychrobacter sp.]